MSSIDSMILRFGDVLATDPGTKVMFISYCGDSGYYWTGMSLTLNARYWPGEVKSDWVKDGSPGWKLIEVNDDEP